SSSKKSTNSGAPAAKPNAPTASGPGYAAKARERLKDGRPVLVVQPLSSGSSTLSSNKDISITTSSGNITFHDATHGSMHLKMEISWRRPNCLFVVPSAPAQVVNKRMLGSSISDMQMEGTWDPCRVASRVARWPRIMSASHLPQGDPAGR